jgi:tRNA pseudouridine13 synthase
MTAELPFATPELPGIGGSIASKPEDIEIEEVPKNKFAQKGAYLYVYVEKKGISTIEAMKQLSVAANVNARDLSAAGFTSGQAITRQWIAVRRQPENGIMYLETPSLAVVSQTRHNSRLHSGHVVANRFKVRVRAPKPGARAAAEKTLARLALTGIPNYFSVQRFGPRGDAPAIGRALLKNDHQTVIDLILGRPDPGEKDSRLKEARKLYDEGKITEAMGVLPRSQRTEWRMLEALSRGSSREQAVRFLKTNERRYYISALQAAVFNTILSRRIASFHQALEGDLVLDHASGEVEAAAKADAQLDIKRSATGLMPGTETTLAGGEPGVIERDVLDEMAISNADFESLKPACTGERRPLRFTVEPPVITEDGADLMLQFQLPMGCYVTSLLRELTKTALVDVEEEGPDTIS